LVNCGAICYLLTIWVFVFFPIATPVTPATMNWNILMFGATMIFAVCYYFLVGRRRYISPVSLVERDL
jgi:choline transport protein